MTALAVASASLRRMLRDRTALFFVVLLPVLVIAIIGTVVRNPGGFRIGVVSAQASGQPLAGTLVDDLGATGPVHLQSDEQTARTALRRGELDAVVLIPTGLEAALLRGDDVVIPVLAGGAESTQRPYDPPSPPRWRGTRSGSRRLRSPPGRPAAPSPNSCPEPLLCNGSLHASR